MNLSKRVRVCALAAIGAALALAPSAFAQGQVLYGADGAAGNSADRLQVLDPATGQVTQNVGPVGYALTGLAEDPTTGVLYGVTGNVDVRAPGHLITVDKATGAGTVIGDVDADPNDPAPVADITFTSDGTLYGWQTDGSDLATLDKATGLATVVGDSGIAGSGFGLAADGSDNLFLAGNGDDGPLYTVDKATGVATAGPTLDGVQGFGIGALAFDAAGTLFGARASSVGAIPSDLLSIDTTTGALTRRGVQTGLSAIEFVDRSARTISLERSKKKVKKGKKVVLSGVVDAGTESACDAAQAVQILRKKKGQSAFSAFKQVTTDSAGAYRSKFKVKKTASYQATVSGPAFCADATSPNRKVKVKKK